MEYSTVCHIRLNYITIFSKDPFIVVEAGECVVFLEAQAVTFSTHIAYITSPLMPHCYTTHVAPSLLALHSSVGITGCRKCPVNLNGSSIAGGLSTDSSKIRFSWKFDS